MTRKDVDEVERKSISNEEATGEKVQREEEIALGELRASYNSNEWGERMRVMRWSVNEAVEGV